MKITVELDSKDLRDICRFTGEKKKGPAIRKMVADALMLKRRRELSDQILAEGAGVELPSWQEMKAQAKAKDAWNS